MFVVERGYVSFFSVVKLLVQTYPDFSGGRLPEVKTRSNKTLVLLSSLKIERKKKNHTE